METIEKECENKCPKCNSQNLLWIDEYIEDEYVIYNVKCRNCGIYFDEAHKIVYSMSIYTKED